MKTGFFEEQPGIKSWIRLAGTYCLLLAGFVVVNSTLKCKDVPIDLIVVLLSAGVAGKVAQKFAEK